MRSLQTLLLVLAMLCCCSICAAAEVPPYAGFITDAARIISDETKNNLQEMLSSHEAQTGNQIAVLTTPSLDGDTIEAYAVKVFEIWQLGQKDKDNGVLIVIAPNERLVRIEVGYGLEGTLTDATAGRIIQQVMLPSFKAGDFNGGISAGVSAVVGELAGDRQQATTNTVKKRSPAGLSLTERIFIGLFIFSIIGMFTFIGIITPGAGWFLYVFLIPFWSVFSTIIISRTAALPIIISYLIGFPLAKLLLGRTAWYRKAKTDLKTKGRASIGGFTLGSSAGTIFSGGGGSGGGSIGGGSSGGGGGGSGGGGASGGW